jgi:hypothetical protein
MAKPTEYTVHFRTDIESATTEIPARSPEAALAKARAIAADDDRRDDLFFEPYSGRFPINEISVETHDGKEVAMWLDDDLLVRLAADDLLAAIEDAVTALNTARRFDVPALNRDSYQVAAKGAQAITKARGQARP